jgi:hypothetical protein
MVYLFKVDGMASHQKGSSNFTAVQNQAPMNLEPLLFKHQLAEQTFEAWGLKPFD